MRRGLIAATAMLLVLAACGGDDGSDSQLEGVASLGDDSGASSGDRQSSESGARASFEDGLLAFTSCMRDNGIDMPDLQVDASGTPRIPLGVLETFDTTSPEFVGAFAQCVGILGDSSPIDITADPALNAAVQDQLQDFAECMRNNGLESFPDPIPGFDGTNSPFPITEIDTASPNLQPALDECLQLISFPTIGD